MTDVIPDNESILDSYINEEERLKRKEKRLDHEEGDEDD